MTFSISNCTWSEMIREFESKRYSSYNDEKIYNSWDVPLEELNPTVLKMIFDLYKRIKELEYKLQERGVSKWD